MTDKRLDVANLKPEAVEKLKSLEAELGKVVVAYDQPKRPATLTENQVHRLQQLEVELGVCLLAYE